MSVPVAAVPIAATDRVSDVLARDESLVEIFVRHAPHFSKLRNRAMRRVMARLVTVDQAARTAGVPVEVLLRDLNGKLGIAAEPAGATGVIPPGDAARRPAQPADSVVGASSHPSYAPVVELDVREDLRAGREPFPKIMAAVGTLGTGDVLHIRAIFEPVPLFTVLGKRGFVHESREEGPDDWSVWFWRPATAGSAPRAPSNAVATPGSAPAPAPAPGGPDDSNDASVPPTVWLDVRGLEPPQPLLQTLSALEALPAGHALVQVNVRVPRFLLPMLAERGYACEIDESHGDRVLVRIWRPV